MVLLPHWCCILLEIKNMVSSFEVERISKRQPVSWYLGGKGTNASCVWFTCQLEGPSSICWADTAN